jgi:prolyl-tRNA editing enzyme YbaK/EbsC (Cys-tRNA(Pro) deacylase)/GNAT superfamily N-acetyltransferase
MPHQSCQMVELREFLPCYQTEVEQLVLPIQQKEFGVVISLSEQPDLLDIAGTFQKGGGNFWLALYKGRVVGCVGLVDIGNGQAALKKMFVEKNFRGKKPGVAAALFNKVRQWCVEQDVNTIFLGTTAQMTAAHRFYEKNGFLVLDAGSLPDSFPRVQVDTKFYCLRLPDDPAASAGDSKGRLLPDLELLHVRVAEAIRRHGLAVDVMSCDPARADTAEFCDYYCFAADQVCNTIVVAARTNPAKYACCVILATCKLDVNKKICSLLEVRRASFASGEQTTETTGMLIGGVTPVGVENMPVYVDSAVTAKEMVVLGGGNRASKLLLNPTELSRLPNVQVVHGIGLAR